MVSRIGVGGMHCGGCALALKNGLEVIPGVTSVTVNVTQGWISVEHDPKIVAYDVLCKAIEEIGYSIDKGSDSESKTVRALKGLGLLLLFLAVVWLSPLALPPLGTLDSEIGYLTLIGLGLMTSVHCIGMCGGINLAVCVNKTWHASLFYNLGRMTSYTIIGGILGAFGGILSISPTLKVALAILSGFFMLLIGLGQLGLMKAYKIPALIPKSMSLSAQNLMGLKKGPYMVGLANGLMPCGPLAALQIYALGSGSWFAGASGMFAFSLGTFPLMFSFGLFAGLLSKKRTKQLVKLSGVLLICLSLLTISRGLTLGNISAKQLLPIEEASETLTGIVATQRDGYQEVLVPVSPSGYHDIIVVKDIPVKLTFSADNNALTSCNEAVVIPEFDIEVGLAPGKTTVEFTPTAVGEFNYSCWMGMLRNTIIVVDSAP